MSAADYLAAVRKLTEDNLSVAELIQAAGDLTAAGERDLATQIYKLWIRVNVEHPLRYAALFNYSVVLQEIGDLDGAKAALEQALAQKPDFYPAENNLCNLLEKRGAVQEALLRWSAVATRYEGVTGAAVEHRLAALKQMARILETHRFLANAETALRQSLDIDPLQREVVEHFVSLRLAQCEWPVLSNWERPDRKTLMARIGPLSLAAYTDDPIFQLAAGWAYNKHFVGYPSAADREACPPAHTPARAGRRRIGYMSSDLRAHAVGHLMGELFELHDRKRFEIFVYYCGQPGTDPIQARIRAAVDHWVDITALDDRATARRIAADAIDILVDLNGYTRDSRTRVIALRPAPIIVNWLGFPGSMGSPYHHYILADDWIIPPDHEIYYSEKVLRLPCYQPNDRKRIAPASVPTRGEAGLPERGIVYCCFNSVHKITRFTFERWIAILKRVPGSVLWLLAGPDAVNARLVDYAAARGIEAGRILFAERTGPDRHLARCQLADLFLDTSPYGAHVTASDALWMGVPILTFSGRGFASRVCGSLVRAAGLPELVCANAAEYVERAVALGTNRAALDALKAKLRERRDDCVLFDTKAHVRQLEKLYGQMWKDYREGTLPRPDLANMEAYQEAGIERDPDAVEVATVPDYREWYRSSLARAHRFAPLPADTRLWTAADIAAIERAG